MAFLYLFGAALYAMRIPERFAPGRFDLWCNSHQLFHVLLMGGAYMHLRSSTRLLEWRDSVGGCAEQLLFPEGAQPWGGGGNPGWNMLDVGHVWDYVHGRVLEVMGYQLAA